MNNTMNLQELSKETSKELLKVAGSYVPTGQNKRGYVNLIIDNNLSFKTASGQTEYGTIEDLVSFLYVCNRTGLDPLAKQIFTQWRWNSKLSKYQMIIVTGIDGFRLTAQRTGRYGGQDDAKFEVEELFNPIEGTTIKQLKAVSTVYILNKNDRFPVTATARWNEYAVKDNKGNYTSFWKDKPYLMLSKCAEALALRKAFPQELSALYTNDEVGVQQDEVKAKISSLPTPDSQVKIEEDTQTIEAKQEQQKQEVKPEPVKLDDKQDKDKLKEILSKKDSLNNSTK